MEHYFRLPIGDWSKDGHGECEYYLIRSNVSVEELREIYFETKERVGFGLDGRDAPCSEYEDYLISEDQICKLGLNWKNYEHLADSDYVTANVFVSLFIDYLMSHNSNVKLEICDEFPLFPFYGFDNRHRHICYMGYGLFS